MRQVNLKTRKRAKPLGFQVFCVTNTTKHYFFFVFGGFLTRKLVPDVDSTVGQIQTGQESGTFWKSGRGRSSNLVGRICPPPPSWSVNILGACPPPLIPRFRQPCSNLINKVVQKLLRCIFFDHEINFLAFPSLSSSAVFESLDWLSNFCQFASFFISK